MLGDDRKGGGTGERPLAAEHFVEDDPQRVDVAAQVDVFPSGLFGGDVVGSAENVTRVRERRLVTDDVDRLRQPEVGYANLVPGVDQDVRRLQITVHDLLFPRRIQSFRRLMNDLQRFLDRQALFARDPLCECLPGDKLHDDVGSRVNLTERIDVHDVRMLDGRHHAGLSKEARTGVMTLRKLLADVLHGDATTELIIDGQEDCSHPPHAEPRHDRIAWDRNKSVQFGRDRSRSRAERAHALIE